MSNANSVTLALRAADSIGQSGDYQKFVEMIRKQTPWRFQLPPGVLERDYLRVVDHHLRHLLPCVQRYMTGDIRRVLDFGCGSGGSAIALAMVYPHIRCYGADIDAAEIAVARERAQLYGVADRCEFHHVAASKPLPFQDGFFDFSLCSSVLEYAVDRNVRRFCVQEMARLVKGKGLLFFSVPNRLYPFEIHSSKWGWNYFPKATKAAIVDSSAWEVCSLARPVSLQLYRTPLLQLLRPWSNFCFRKGVSSGAEMPANGGKSVASASR
jgi:SAM-dependent methyltransferase